MHAPRDAHAHANFEKSPRSAHAGADGPRGPRWILSQLNSSKKTINGCNVPSRVDFPCYLRRTGSDIDVEVSGRARIASHGKLTRGRDRGPRPGPGCKIPGAHGTHDCEEECIHGHTLNLVRGIRNLYSDSPFRRLITMAPVEKEKRDRTRRIQQKRRET